MYIYTVLCTSNGNISFRKIHVTIQAYYMCEGFKLTTSENKPLPFIQKRCSEWYNALDGGGGGTDNSRCFPFNKIQTQ